MPGYQAPLGVPQIQPDPRRARHSMPIMPTGSGQNDTGQKHTIDAGQLGTRDTGDTTLTREELLMAKHPKTDDELIDDIRRAAREIRDVEHEMPIVGSVAFWQIEQLESHANALHIFCKLLRQRLEAQDPSIQHLRATLTEGE